MFVYIEAEYLERNYSGPGLFQLTSISQKLYDELSFICNNTKMKLDVAFTAKCEEDDQEKTVSYCFGVKKIKLTPITDLHDIDILEKYFGSNFCNYDFIQNIFRKNTLESKPKNSEFRNFTHIDKINGEKFVWISYSGSRDSMPLYDYSFEQEHIKDFSEAFKKNLNFPRSLDNTLWLPAIKLSRFDLYTLPEEESKQLETIFIKYDIYLSCHNIIEWEYDNDD